eukprot:m.10166 g.10166  ORF g.10166 m.10166 type:complete len:463 (+) comp5530_c0_seq1:170-1558(+)
MADLDFGDVDYALEIRREALEKATVACRAILENDGLDITEKQKQTVALLKKTPDATIEVMQDILSFAASSIGASARPKLLQDMVAFLGQVQEITPANVAALGQKAQQKMQANLASIMEQQDQIKTLLDTMEITDGAKEDYMNALVRFIHKKKGIALVFVLDATFSMDVYRNTLRDKLVALIRAMSDKFGDMVCRVGCVAFWDRKEVDVARRTPKVFEMQTVSADSVKALMRWINELEIKGGNDDCEDFGAGLTAAVQLLEDSVETTKLVVCMTDAPAHGKVFYTEAESGGERNFDSFPNDDGSSVFNALDSFARGNVDIFMAEIPNQQRKQVDGTERMLTATMFAECRSKYDAVKGDNVDPKDDSTFDTFDLADPESNFVPAVLRSITSSMTNSQARRLAVEQGVDINPNAIYADGDVAADGPIGRLSSYDPSYDPAIGNIPQYLRDLGDMGDMVDMVDFAA